MRKTTTTTAATASAPAHSRTCAPAPVLSERCANATNDTYTNPRTSNNPCTAAVAANPIFCNFDSATPISLPNNESQQQANPANEGHVRSLPQPRMQFKVPPSLFTSNLVSNSIPDSSLTNEISQQQAQHSAFYFLRAPPLSQPSFPQLYPELSFFNPLASPDYPSLDINSLLSNCNSMNCSSEVPLASHCQYDSILNTMGCFSHLASPPTVADAFDFTTSAKATQGSVPTAQSPSSSFLDSLSSPHAGWADTPKSYTPDIESSPAAIQHQLFVPTNSTSFNADNLQMPNYMNSFPNFDFDFLLDNENGSLPSTTSTARSNLNAFNAGGASDAEMYLANMAGTPNFYCLDSNNLVHPAIKSGYPPTPPRVRVSVSNDEVMTSRRRNVNSTPTATSANAGISVLRAKRCTITGSAKEFLLRKFSENRLPTLQEYKDFAVEVNVEVKQVRTWFKNMRLRCPTTAAAAGGRFKR
ncbi:hypothetical protein HDU78_006506 [Chytriomyces hyalinus]|nr:hypothetical protein HDU78_006506 [Chytriomyces hyalinus]